MWNVSVSPEYICGGDGMWMEVEGGTYELLHLHLDRVYLMLSRRGRMSLRYLNVKRCEHSSIRPRKQTHQQSHPER